jgi:hypothetical protein
MLFSSMYNIRSDAKCRTLGKKMTTQNISFGCCASLTDKGLTGRLRGCLFGLILAFHSKKLPKRTKQPALALCFSKATRENTRARESTSEGASCGFPQWCHLNPKRYNHLPSVLAYLPAFAIETVSDQIVDT